MVSQASCVVMMLAICVVAVCGNRVGLASDCGDMLSQASMATLGTMVTRSGQEKPGQFLVL